MKISNKKKRVMEYVTLNNGINMTKLGSGVYHISTEECERCVLDAISAVYRSVDIADYIPALSLD